MTQFFDEKFINLALNLSLKHQGHCAENPAVGCVIVKDNIILATGVTAAKGRPHAEIVALDKISDKNILQKATIYITLEPCSHFGVTAPCVDEIVKYKFARAVICMIDPDVRVCGKGIDKLKQNGIVVDLGVAKNKAELINRDFIKAKITNLPFVTAKIATSLDGKIACANGQSQWLTNQRSRDFVHSLRAKNQGILVGANTIRNDNPSLNCRLSGLEDRSCAPIVITSSLDFSFSENVFSNNFSGKTFIICPSLLKGHKKLEKWLDQNSSNQVIFIDVDAGNKNQPYINLRSALEKLCQFGINSILVEGGGKILSQFYKENLIDELIWLQAPIVMGNDAKPAFSDFNYQKIADIKKYFALKKIFQLNDDVVKIFTKINQ